MVVSEKNYFRDKRVKINYKKNARNVNTKRTYSFT
jgi:hypothetical protein